MRSSEDSADDEFVFVTNREVRVQTCGGGPVPRATGRPHRHQPRLNQPIPTTLDLDPPPGLPSACAALPPNTTTTTTTTARAKVTPLPPELIELLPPHLRENTIPDFSATSLATNGGKLYGRPAPPPPKSLDDYCSLDDPDTATSPHYFQHPSELVSSSDAFSSASDDASSSQYHTRASSLPLQRPCLPPSSTGASYTAPAALTLTDSGISSAGSSSISSRSSSSKSLPRESPGTLSSRPSHPPSSRGPGVPTRNAAVSMGGSAFPSARVSNSVMATGKEERPQGRGRLLARTPSPSPLPTACRATSGSQEGVNEATYYTKPPHRDVHHRELEAEHWERSQPNTVGSAFVPTSSHKLRHTPTREMRTDRAREDSPNRVEVSAGSGVAFYNVQKTASFSPARASPACCTSSPQPVCRHVRPSPPPSPEMRRAWNVVGVPVSSGGSYGGRSSPVGRISPTPSGRPLHYRLVVPQSDPNAIYDNIMLRHPPQSPSYASPATPPCRLVHSPVLGKPPSPPQQRRASRSPSPSQGWVSFSRPGSPHCAPCHHTPNLQHGSCFVPVWGSSPQLCPDGGAHVCPGYLYSGPPCAVVCASRSHSCDRLPAQPSPPPSPVCGRRSPSPWRGGSAPPVSHRHSPSPDRTSGRPPRPRRPPHRKAKTVEVGYLGAASQSPAPAAVTRSPSPAMATPMYMPASAIISATSPHAATIQADANTTNKTYLAVNSREVSPLYQNLRNNCGAAAHSGHEGGAWPEAPMVAAPPPSRSPSRADKHDMNNDSKQKVTYKTAFYKCMKNLLKPTQ